MDFWSGASVYFHLCLNGCHSPSTRRPQIVHKKESFGNVLAFKIHSITVAPRQEAQSPDIMLNQATATHTSQISTHHCERSAFRICRRPPLTESSRPSPPTWLSSIESALAPSRALTPRPARHISPLTLAPAVIPLIMQALDSSEFCTSVGRAAHLASSIRCVCCHPRSSEMLSLSSRWPMFCSH